MGVFSWIILGLLLFVFLRQLPSHKLYILTRDLEEAQTFFATAVEEGLVSGSYADDFRRELNQLQVETDKLSAIMMGVWPFSPRDFYHMVDGVTRESYKLRDEVEVVRNKIYRTSSYEKLHRDMYRITAPCPSIPITDYAIDASDDMTTYSYTPSAPSPDKPSLSPFPDTPTYHCPPATHFLPVVHTTYPL